MSTPEHLSRYLDPNSIEVYLMAHNWEVKTRNRLFSTWRRPDQGDPSAFLFVPLSAGPADYEDRLRELVLRLAAVEERDIDTVLTNLRYATADLIRIGLVSPRIGPGELPIEDGRNLFDGARDLMLWAACAAVQPRASFGPRVPTAARDYLEGVRLGQTEKGSYVLTVISDVAPPEQQALVPDDDVQLDTPFERKVTSRLMESLSATQSAAKLVVDEQADIGETFEGVVDRGVSANLCAAIARMAEEQAGSRIEVRMSWAASRPPIATELPQAVAFPSSALPILSDAQGVLRQLGPFDDVIVDGYVTRLNRGKDEAAIGSIVIDGDARGERRNIHVELPDVHYHLAVKAHDDRYPVRIMGTLSKKGRHWVLSEPGQLRLEGIDPER